MARPERIRVGVREDDDLGATDLELPARRVWPFGLIFGSMFLIFAVIEWTTIAGMRREAPRDVFDLMLPFSFFFTANRPGCRAGGSSTCHGSGR